MSSATDRLRELLDERGADYRVSATGYSIDIGPYTTAYANRSDTTLDVSLRQVTPEQAIAATLGADASPTQAESSGTLTAEKVRELMEENSRQYPSPTDPYVWLTEYDWQAIADELNATLGTGACRDVCNGVSEFTCSACGFNCDLTSWISLFDGDDGRHRHHHHGTPNFCPNCGRKVVTA